MTDPTDTTTQGAFTGEGKTHMRPVSVRVRNGEQGKAISRNLWGIFLEDINYAVDGGLNAELVQNGAFEYDRADDPHWSSLSCWTIGHEGPGSRDVSIRTDTPVAEENPHHLAVRLESGVTTLANRGFDGMVLHAGRRYRLSLWARADGCAATLEADLVDCDVPTVRQDARDADAHDTNADEHDGHDATTDVVAHAATVVGDRDGRTAATDGTATGDADGARAAHGAWTRVELDLVAARDVTNGALRLTVRNAATTQDAGGAERPSADTVPIVPAPTEPADRATTNAPTAPATLRLDWVSLRPCGEDGEPLLFRPDLLEALKDLSPRFMRFPGGCITHGLGTGNMYRWKRTIGQVEHRPHQFNLWGYHQSFTIGFHEYFLLCEAIGAEPVPILPVGVSCQNTPGGVTTVPMEEMQDIVDDALDLIEYANGPADSPWGARRAAAGHPEPFGLTHLGLGNEDSITAAFKERFALVADAVKRRYPDVTVIGTVGPVPAGPDYDAGWAFARERHVDMVDEHAYKSPQWWFSHLDHYDGRDGADADGSTTPRIYLGEYGSWSNMQLSALSEAAVMTSLERNGDVVRMASYAPLFGRVGHTQWHPDLIYFDGGRVMRTASYWVQRMFARTACTRTLDVALADAPRLTPAPRDRTGLRFAVTGSDAVSVGDIRIAAVGPDGRGRNVAAPDVVVGEGTPTVDTGLDVTADDYRIAFTVRRLTGQDGMTVDFGALDGRDHFRWAFGDWGNKYMILKRVGDGIADEAVPAVEGGVQAGETYRVEFAVERQGAHVTVRVNGRLVHEYRDSSEETRFVAAAGRDETHGETVVRLVNATPDAHDVALAFDAPLDGKATATVTTLAAPWDAGRPFEESPAQPTTRHVDAATLGRTTVPPFSLTVIAVPDATTARRA
ncbi:alpha-L-arabinofuranosidase [Bifidobacterium sp. CP2]|uniref:alpha-L-arabinofuranosidase C-terminal domain-containing protein n=1 Tax=Bifidobacterium sp. CP2 TaxID=2809025 RepID=UPI001BDCE36D|nr:alpha-L-arabinofuranosidase C-terminal domain-containing protein [Bifidobacterium sp. CP2]MBT1180798.1 alpha-L-arabinofuranosidase [Bifidobacterium sp. CP2]